VRQNNDTANTTSSEPEGHWSVFSPQTARPELTLIVPGAWPTYTPVPSPVTAVTQLSLEIPEPQETEPTTQDATSQTRQPKPFIQPSDISLIVPVTDAVSDKTSFITVVPTARIESSATYIWVPGAGTTSHTRAPKMPHLEHTASELILPSKPTDSPDTHEGDDDSNHETAGPDVAAQWPTQIGVIVGSGTGSAESEQVTGSPTQHIPIPQLSGTTQISRGGGEAHATPIFGVDGTPLIAGGSPITVGGTTYSLATTGSAVLINGEAQATQIFAVDNTPLVPGGFPITVSGTTYSLPLTGSAVIVNGEAQTTPMFAVDNTILIAGGSPITVSGTTYSLPATGTAVVVNGNTVSVTTDTAGRLVPVQTTSDSPASGPTDSATGQALGGLSIVSAGATATGGAAQETGSIGAQYSSGRASATATQGAASTASANSDDAGATATTTDGEAALQSDSAGASKSPTWTITAMAGAIGLLAVVV
jgi:hypothetical protein